MSPGAVLEVEGVRHEFGQEVVGVSTVATLMGMSSRTVRHWCAQGKFKGAYQWDEAGNWRIPLESVLQFRP